MVDLLDDVMKRMGFEKIEYNFMGKHGSTIIYRIQPKGLVNLMQISKPRLKAIIDDYIERKLE